MDEIEVRIVNEPTPTCENVTYVLKNWTHCADFNNYRDCVHACGLSTGGAPNVEKRYVSLININYLIRYLLFYFPGTSTKKKIFPKVY